MDKRERYHSKRDKTLEEVPNQAILDFIGSPNAWTPKIEDVWLKELRKLSAIDIYRRFPPIKKPPNVGRRGRNYGWGI